MINEPSFDLEEPVLNDTSEDQAYAYERAILAEARAEILGRPDRWIPPMEELRPKVLDSIELQGHRPNTCLVVTFAYEHGDKSMRTLTWPLWDEHFAGYRSGTREPVIGVINTMIIELAEA